MVPKEHAYYLTSAIFIRLLVHLARRYISWPSPQQRRQLPAPLMPRQETFSGCVGFLDGSGIPLQSKPKYDHETYFLRKKIYGLIPSDRPVHVYIHTGQATLRAAECEAITTNADATAYTSNGGGGGFCGGGGGGGRTWRVVNCQLELSIPFCCLSFFGKCKLCSQ